MAKESGSKLCIELGDKYLITSNNYSFVLVEKKTVKTGVKAGQEHLTNVGYFQNLGTLAKSLINKEIRESELTTLQQINERVEELGKGIGQMLEQIIQQTKGK